MKKLLITLVLIALVIGGGYAALLASGTIGRDSLRMVLNVVAGVGGPKTSASMVEQRYQLPPGFRIQVYADNLPKARFMRFTPAGELLVSRPHMGDIVLLRPDNNGDGQADAVETLIDGLQRPLGIDFDGQWLYIAEDHRVGRVLFDSDLGVTTGAYEPIIEGLGNNGNHWSKTIGFGPDGLLYLAQGSTCNICTEDDARRATMMRFNPDGSNGEVIATGLRNSVGFDWSPFSGDLYATDNGRDLMGDDFPPCELNRIQAGKFYGWPYFNGDNLPDPDMGADPLADSRKPTAPAHGFRAHNAPLGMSFVDTQGWPAGFERTALVALHGSWNRSIPDGYKVVSLHWTEAGIQERDFLTGFNRDGEISGRPVDVAQGPDGAIYVSDDYAGAIYRVTYGAAAAASLQLPAGGISRLDAQPPEWLADANLETMSANGKALYQRYGCRSCHEEGLNPKLLTDLNQRLGYNAVIETLAAPQSPMPVYPLSESERRELAVFLLAPTSAQ